MYQILLSSDKKIVMHAIENGAFSKVFALLNDSVFDVNILEPVLDCIHELCNDSTLLFAISKVVPCNKVVILLLQTIENYTQQLRPEILEKVVLTVALLCGCTSNDVNILSQGCEENDMNSSLSTLNNTLETDVCDDNSTLSVLFSVGISPLQRLIEVSGSSAVSVGVLRCFLKMILKIGDAA